MVRSAPTIRGRIFVSQPASSVTLPPRVGEGLALAKLVERDDFGGRLLRFSRLFRLGRGDLCGQSRNLRRRRGLSLELQAEMDRWIGEGHHSGEWNGQPLPPALKAQAHRKGVVPDFEPAELV